MSVKALLLLPHHYWNEEGRLPPWQDLWQRTKAAELRIIPLSDVSYLPPPMPLELSPRQMIWSSLSMFDF